MTADAVAILSWLIAPTLPLPEGVREALARHRVEIGPDWRTVTITGPFPGALRSAANRAGVGRQAGPCGGGKGTHG